MTTRRPSRRHLLAALPLLLATACQSATPTARLDVDAVATDISEGLAPAYEADGLTLFGVSCPPGDWAAGDVFACTAEVERQFVRVRVEVGDGPGSFDWTTLDIVHRLDATEAVVGAEMSTSLGDQILLSCGSPRIRVLPIGASFRCDAIDSQGNLAPALLTVNGSGQTGWEVLG